MFVLHMVILVLLVGNVLLMIFAGRRIRRSEQRAQSDAVTGILNSIGFARKTHRYLSNNNPQYAVVIMELRNYRQITETFGRDKCDQVLRHLAKTLKTALSMVEPMARFSGGTFCFLMKNRQESAILDRLTRLSKSVNRYNQNAQIPYELDLHFGVYIPADSTESLTEILEKIEELMESSDQRCSFYREEKKEAASRKWELIQQMDRSLHTGDFLVFLQPKVRLSDNKIVGAEALIRWRHPQRGMLTPDMFIPTLEEYHLLPQYDLYLFEQTCRQLERWTKAGMTACPVSVNLSHETARQKNFMQPYVRLVQKYHILPENIEFELSKKLQQLDMQELSAIVDEIHANNFRCALDRFGGDVISLRLLRELDVDTIKLDHRLFSSENNNRRNRFVLEGIIKIASQLQIHTVAEGIDNASQVQYLKQAGCDLVQGYYYFQPLSVDAFGYTAYENGELRYVEEENNNSAQKLFTSGSGTSGSIIMLSLLTGSDRVMFSELFSPMLDEQHTVSNAMSFFQRSDLIHENDRKDFFQLLERCMKENGWVENTIRFYTSKGRYEWLEVHLHKEYFPAVGETAISGTLVNVAGWKNEVNRWKEKANRDALTGLYNREYFERFASDALDNRTVANAAVVFIDIDDFKQVNDTLGHMVGDDVICWFAKRILGVFEQTDIVARYGGDEFVVFVNGIEKAELRNRLQRLCAELQVPFRSGTIEYHASGTIGAAVFPEDGGSYLELLDHADSALYEAKRQGKKRFVLYRPGLAEAPKD